MQTLLSSFQFQVVLIMTVKTASAAEMHFETLCSLRQPCMTAHCTILYEPGILPGSVNQCISGNVCMRSASSRNCTLKIASEGDRCHCTGLLIKLIQTVLTSLLQQVWLYLHWVSLCSFGGSLSVVTLGPDYCHFALQLGMSQYTPIRDMTPLNTPILHRLV